MAKKSITGIKQAALPMSKILIPMPERRIASDTGVLNTDAGTACFFRCRRCSFSPRTEALIAISEMDLCSDAGEGPSFRDRRWAPAAETEASVAIPEMNICCEIEDRPVLRGRTRALIPISEWNLLRCRRALVPSQLRYRSGICSEIEDLYCDTGGFMARPEISRPIP